MTTLKARINGEWVTIGGNTDNEVHVGPDDPIAARPATELWYDSDEPALLPDNMRWFTAWGVVGRGTMLGHSGTGVAPGVIDVSYPLTVTLVAGRRYKLSACARAVQPQGAAGNAFLRFTGTDLPNTGTYAWLAGPYQQINITEFFDATVSKTVSDWKVQFSPNVAVNLYTDQVDSFFMVEDVGPVTGASMLPPSAGFLPVGMRVYGPYETATSTGMTPQTETSITYLHNLNLTATQQANSMVAAMPMDGSWGHAVGWRGVINANSVVFYLINQFTSGFSAAVKFRFVLFVGG